MGVTYSKPLSPALRAIVDHRGSFADAVLTDDFNEQINQGNNESLAN